MNAIKPDGNGLFYVQDPRARLPLVMDWSAHLGALGTTIASSVWTSDAGVTLSGPTSTTTTASVIVEGGVAGSAYVVRNTITCANGYKDSRSVRVKVTDR